jgi:hypothetical protein
MGCLFASLGAHGLNLFIDHPLDFWRQFLGWFASPNVAKSVPCTTFQLLTEHGLEGLWCEQPSGLCTLCQHVGQFDLNGGHRIPFSAFKQI